MSASPPKQHDQNSSAHASAAAEAAAAAAAEGAAEKAATAQQERLQHRGNYGKKVEVQKVSVN